MWLDRRHARKLEQQAAEMGLQVEAVGRLPIQWYLDVRFPDGSGMMVRNSDDWQAAKARLAASRLQARL